MIGFTVYFDCLLILWQFTSTCTLSQSFNASDKMCICVKITKNISITQSVLSGLCTDAQETFQNSVDVTLRY